jgi:acetylornithine deacetylase/succinyl-diaminopimelate desuccinylase-like protein
MDPRNRFIRAAFAAIRRVIGAPPVFARSGGTIPAVSFFQNTLKLPTVLMGFGLPDDHIHAPNERFYLPNFYKGIEATINFLAELRTQEGGGITNRNDR